MMSLSVDHLVIDADHTSNSIAESTAQSYFRTIFTQFNSTYYGYS